MITSLRMKRLARTSQQNPRSTVVLESASRKRHAAKNVVLAAQESHSYSRICLVQSSHYANSRTPLAACIIASRTFAPCTSADSSLFQTSLQGWCCSIRRNRVPRSVPSLEKIHPYSTPPNPIPSQS